MPLHKSESESGGMDFTARLLNRPLLPFERQVCDAIGCTEDEYRVLTAEAIRRGQVRPAAYDHIPEIVAGPLVVPAVAATATTAATAASLTTLGTILVNLAIGLALSAISYLLTPKPKSNSTQQRKLADITGTTRFSPTSGFDSQAELADFGEPIPIIFGKWTGTSGGMLVSPKLVWSRMFSYGTQQGVKLLFVVGEQGVTDGNQPEGIAPPAINGIFLGNGVLDSVYESAFAFYWKRTSPGSGGLMRIKAANMIYGTRGNLASGDPEINDDVFSCPALASDTEHAFSSAHSLSNNAQFGCYAGIPNGTGYRVNWQVISILQVDGPDDPGNNLAYQRIKISGDDNGNAKVGGGIQQLGQAGIGRNYSRRMGIVSLNGSTVSDSVGKETRTVSKGDTIVFKISKTQIREDLYSTDDRKISVEDINTYLNEERIAADDALQIGELFMIGRTTWQVTGRNIPIWRPEDEQDQLVTLKCIDINQATTPLIGIVADIMLTKEYLYDTTSASVLDAGAVFYPLMRVDKATVRNTRVCEVIEFGIRSQVHQRFNSLCNFQSLPTPTELRNLDDKRVATTAGTINTYGRRASAFVIYLRPTGVDTSGQPYEWKLLDQLFCVIGNQPIEQYNYIRIKYPQKAQYEFQFVPVNGTDIGRHMSDTTKFWQLFTGASLNNSGSSSLLSASIDVPNYGKFVISTAGNIVTKVDIKANTEFKSKPSTATRIVSKSYPAGLGIRTLLPETEQNKSYLTTTTFVDWYTEPNYAYTVGRESSWRWEIARKAGIGSADNSPLAAGQTIEFEYEHTTSDSTSRKYKVKYRWEKSPLPVNHYSGQKYYWIEKEQNVLSSSDNWDSLSTFILKETITSNNPFKQPPDGAPQLTLIGAERRATGVKSANVPSGRSQAWYEELYGAARDNKTAGRTVSYVMTKTITANKKITFTLKSSVFYDPNESRGEGWKYTEPSITVSSDPNETTGVWTVGNTFQDTRSSASSNPWRTGYVGAEFIVQGVTEDITQSVTDTGRSFEDQSQYADISFYGSLVEKSNSGSSEHSVVYVNEMTSNAVDPEYENMTLTGLSLKASRNFSSLDQLRVWLKDGIQVRHFHPDETGSNESSNLFCDLVYHLLTDQVAGVGKVLNMSRDYAPLINTADLAETAKFLKANKLFFDGAITNAVNIRQFISETAPYMLCNFVIADGQFSLQPAVPTDSGGNISTQPLTIKQLFTSGNILEDSFELEYLPAEERKNFTAVMRFREERENQLPQERNIAVNWKGESGNNYILESFDLTQYCTNRDHAFLVARFLLSIRRRITHTIRFQTTPFGITLAPGDFIRVVTETSPYNAVQNGSISSTGVITSASTFADGQYSVLYYRTGFEDVQQGTMNVSGQIVQNTEMRGGLFSVLNATVSQNVYMVEQLTLDSESTVQITASEFPCDSLFSSLIAQDLVNADRFEVDA